MIVDGRAAVAATPAALRDVLTDPERLVAALPNVDAFTWLPGDGPRTFTATLRPATALGEVPVRTRWAPAPCGPDELGYAVEGRTDEHHVQLAIAVRLVASEGGGALATWTVDCRTTGTLRAVGQRVLAHVVAHQARLVLAAADRAAREAAETA